jgi:hypothetical protein
MLKSSVPESSEKYSCIFCDYNTSRLSQYNRHILTPKHKKLEKSTDFNILSTKINKKSSDYKCECGKDYKERSGLWRHKKVCIYKNCDKEEEHILDSQSNKISDKDLIAMLVGEHKKLIQQNSEMLEIIKGGTHNNNSHNNNKTFNLNLFLNETCKDAMNIMDFVETIKLKLSDLENVGKNGYVEGISNIITSNLKALEVNKRPIHCTDKKRETLYIKDENKWEKEDEDKKRIRKVIKKVANKNIKLLQIFKEVHPDCSKSSSLYSDQYNKIIIEAMGGAGDNDIEKEDKIIKNISSITMIDKNVKSEVL